MLLITINSIVKAYLDKFILNFLFTYYISLPQIEISRLHDIPGTVNTSKANFVKSGFVYSVQYFKILVVAKSKCRIQNFEFHVIAVFVLYFILK